jgi:altronate hydrolase
MSGPNVIVISSDDNVGVVIGGAAVGDALVSTDGKTVEATSDIPGNHKVALVDIARGNRVVKYGEVIGVATEDIKKGAWIHTHNLVFKEGTT